MSATGRRILSITLVALLAAGLVVPGMQAASAASTKTIVLTIDSTVATVAGSSLTLDAAPFIAGGRTMLPIRFVAEAMGAGVSYTTKANGGVSEVRLGLPDSPTTLKAITLSLTSTTATVDGQSVALDATPVIRQGRTFLPVRFIAEQLGAKVTWVADPSTGRTKIVTIVLPVITVSVPTQLAGAGATFPLPLYTKMFDVYNSSTSVRVNYQGIGSGGGIKALTDRTVDFGASDAFLTVAETTAMGAPVLHISTCVGAVVLTYNLDGNPALRCDARTVSDIYMGTITRWNDSRIAALNPGISLPDQAITTVHRSDGSGTTSIFTNYLSMAVATWKSKVGAGKSVSWPVGLGGKGNDGVAGLVSQNKGAIGYVELVYAISSKLPFATMRNSTGNFIVASLSSSGRAAQIQLPDDLKVFLMNSSDAQAYPIAAFTWLLVYRDQKYAGRTLGQAIALKRMLNWMLTTGQSVNEGLGYGKLPGAAVTKAQALVRSLTYGGAPIPD
ncbi:MAG: phosphate ABC transporter substrate-binding protein PstS [Caldiserica bacterium]|nr:phosphate ABC transporter substrate-binding protein PstS [Caldisericota bacterium]